MPPASPQPRPDPPPRPAAHRPRPPPPRPRVFHSAARPPARADTAAPPAAPPRTLVVPCSSLSPRRGAEWASPPLYKSRVGGSALQRRRQRGVALEVLRGTSSCKGRSLPSSRLPAAMAWQPMEINPEVREGRRRGRGPRDGAAGAG